MAHKHQVAQLSMENIGYI